MPDQKPVTIIGMPRSGTSMVARTLSLCGMYFGDEKYIRGAAFTNPKGGFEHASFFLLNQLALKGRGASWDYPPPVKSKREQKRVLQKWRGEAEKLVAQFNDHPVWGWKDTPTTLNIPFWRNVVPDLRFIVCVRNPLEVAKSYARITPLTHILIFRLWEQYYDHIFRLTHGCPVIFTHYENWCGGSETEIDRILEWMEWNPAPADRQRAVYEVEDSLRNQTATFEEFLKLTPRRDLVDLYKRACERSGYNVKQK